MTDGTCRCDGCDRETIGDGLCVVCETEGCEPEIRCRHATDGGRPQDVVEQWEEHNKSFQFEPPEGPPESWSQEDYERVHDRLISRRTEWSCQYCSAAPFSSIEKARRHVANQHGEHLYEKYGGRDE